MQNDNEKKYFEFIYDTVQEMILLQTHTYGENKDKFDIEFSDYINNTTAFFIARICEIATSAIKLEPKHKDLDRKSLIRIQFKNILEVAEFYIKQLEDNADKDINSH